MTGVAVIPAFTEDRLLDGKVRLRQPATGYRVAIDPVLLAASVNAADGETVLDIGCGTGAASLCLAARVPGVRVTGIEQSGELIRLASDNVAMNGMEGAVAVIRGDLLRPPPELLTGTFQHVLANPPFLGATRAVAPADFGKAEAHIEGDADLRAWVKFALSMARPKGTLTFIHRADRLEQLLAQFGNGAGEIVIFPLWPGKDRPAKRVIVRARKGSAAPTRLLPGLVLHENDGSYTAAAEAVLRSGSALDLDAGLT